jgi:hypothetical protein
MSRNERIAMKAVDLDLPESDLQAAGLKDYQPGDKCTLTIVAKVGKIDDGTVSLQVTKISSGEPAQDTDDEESPDGAAPDADAAPDDTQGKTGLDYIAAMRRKKMQGMDH